MARHVDLLVLVLIARTLLTSRVIASMPKIVFVDAQGQNAKKSIVNVFKEGNRVVANASVAIVKILQDVHPTRSFDFI